jgi:hypothetical protein
LKQVMKRAARMAFLGGTLPLGAGRTTLHTPGFTRLLQAFATILRRTAGV